MVASLQLLFVGDAGITTVGVIERSASCSVLLIDKWKQISGVTGTTETGQL
jgi:hypothetical protein